ncbi:hypothetical protein [Zhongshania borealis]
MLNHRVGPDAGNYRNVPGSCMQMKYANTAMVLLLSEFSNNLSQNQGDIYEKRHNLWRLRGELGARSIFKGK